MISACRTCQLRITNSEKHSPDDKKHSPESKKHSPEEALETSIETNGNYVVYLQSIE
jgi:ferredoxin